MTVAEYLDHVKDRLLADPLVVEFRVRRERRTLIDGHIRARLSLADGSSLEFSEYVQRFPPGRVQVITYSYHWSDPHGILIRRWDNTPHFPHLPGFPHHIHGGPGGAARSGQPVSIFAILDEIGHLLT